MFKMHGVRAPATGGLRTASWPAPVQFTAEHATRGRYGRRHRSLRAGATRARVGCWEAARVDGDAPRNRLHEVVMSAVAASLLTLTSCNPVLAAEDYNVRLEDVQNPETRAGVRAAARGDAALAEVMFRGVVDAEPESASAWSNLGNAQLSLSRPSEALFSFTRAVELAPDAPVPYLNRALAKEKLGVLARGQADCLGAHAADREAEAAALAYFADAVQDCDKAIELDPKEFAAHHNKAMVLMRMEEYVLATAEHTEAANLAPGIAGYRFKQAIGLYEVGDEAQARRLLQGLTRKYPAYSEAKAALAAVLWGQGELAGAEDQFQAAVAVDPRLGDVEYVRRLLWTPTLVERMSQLVNIQYK